MYPKCWTQHEGYIFCLKQQVLNFFRSAEVYRRDSECFFEYSGKVAGIGKTAVCSGFADTAAAVAQHPLCGFKSDTGEILYKRISGTAVKCSGESCDTYRQSVGDLSAVEFGSGIIALNIVLCCLEQRFRSVSENIVLTLDEIIVHLVEKQQQYRMQAALLDKRKF